MKKIMIRPNGRGQFEVVNTIEEGAYRVADKNVIVVKESAWKKGVLLASVSYSATPSKCELVELIHDNCTKYVDRWVVDPKARHFVSKQKLIENGSTYFDPATLSTRDLVPRQYIELPDGRFMMNRDGVAGVGSILIINKVPDFKFIEVSREDMNADYGKWKVLYGEYYKAESGHDCFEVTDAKDSKHVLVSCKENASVALTSMPLEGWVYKVVTRDSGDRKTIYVIEREKLAGNLARQAEKMISKK